MEIMIFVNLQIYRDIFKIDTNYMLLFQQRQNIPPKKSIIKIILHGFTKMSFLTKWSSLVPNTLLSPPPPQKKNAALQYILSTCELEHLLVYTERLHNIIFIITLEKFADKKYIFFF